MINNIELLKNLTALSAVGGNPFDYFEDTDIPEVTLYGNDDLVSIVWVYGFWSKIKITYIFGEEELDLPVSVGERTRSSVIHINNKVPTNENIIVLCDTPSQSFPHTITLKELITYSRIKRMILDKTLQYIKDHPGVRVMLLGLPSLWHVKNKSAFEKKLIKCNKNQILDKNLVENSLNSYMEDYEYAKEIFTKAKFSTYRADGTYFLKETHSKYVNVENGHRVVPNVPEIYDHTLYMFGNSLCMGVYTDDQHTIQYALQDKLNAYWALPEKLGEVRSLERFRVVNAANGAQPNFNKMWSSIEFHQPKSGDIIMLLTWLPDTILDNPRYVDAFEIYFPQKELRLFDRPHNYGDYVWCDRVHLTCKSYFKLGDCIADRVIAMLQTVNESAEEFSRDWDVLPPDQDTLKNNRYWKYQHFSSNDYLEYIRKCPLTKEKSNTVRWLNFRVKNPLFKGTKYKIYIQWNYEEDVEFKLFLHGNGKIDYLPFCKTTARTWTELIYEYTPSHDEIHWLTISATYFISAGQKLCIKKITIEKIT